MGYGATAYAISETAPQTVYTELLTSGKLNEYLADRTNRLRIVLSAGRRKPCRKGRYLRKLSRLENHDALGAADERSTGERLQKSVNNDLIFTQE